MLSGTTAKKWQYYLTTMNRGMRRTPNKHYVSHIGSSRVQVPMNKEVRAILFDNQMI